ncbi:MAG: DsrE family protein [Nitriliruptorales bacterium]
MAERILVSCTHGEDDAERATVPFIVAGVAAASGHDAAVVCTAEGVWIGTRGYADRIVKEGMAPLRDLYDQLLGSGGEVWLCSACTNVRGITEDNLAEGARIVGAAQIVEAIAAGARSVNLT